MKIEGGRKGITTGATIKDNNYDRKFEHGEFISFDDDLVLYSVHKKKRWEDLENAKQ